MRGILVGLALLGLTSTATAGIYNTRAPLLDPPPEKVRSVVGQLRAVPVKPKGPLDPGSMRGLYLRQAESLEQERSNGTFSTIDRINLGACYIRLGELPKAIRVLTADRTDRNHFLIQANLASAYFLSGDLEVAIRYQRQALEHWPALWATFPAPQLAWYRKCEKLFLRLLIARQVESRNMRKMRGLEVDPLFPGLRLVGPSGEYEAGAHSPDVQDVLPTDAGGITLQLVLWYPADARLYWLLAELLNGAGQVGVAREILDELVFNSDVGAVFKDLRAHRKVLDDAMNLIKVLPIQDPPTVALLLAVCGSIPQGNLAAMSPAGMVGQTVGRALPMEHFVRRPPPSQQAPSAPPDEQPTTVMPFFNWRQIFISFAFGFLTATLIILQWQEWRRWLTRPEAVEQAEEEDEEPPPPEPGAASPDEPEAAKTEAAPAQSAQSGVSSQPQLFPVKKIR
jgi:hypothetical protein